MLTLHRHERPAQPSTAPLLARVPVHPDDAAGLADLVSRGLTRLTLRWTHHVFAPDEAAARAAADRLTTMGWQVGVLAAMPDPFPGWQLRVDRDTVVTAAALDEAREQLTTMAAELLSSYDGWDVAPVPAHD